MQIKRFEADDMNDALRRVKRELGEEAVILTAKEIRRGGLLGAFRKKSVEITAAADYPLDEAGGENDFSKQLALELDTESECERVSLSGNAPSFIPLANSCEPSNDSEPILPNTEAAQPPVKRLFPRQVISAPSAVEPGSTKSRRKRPGRVKDHLTAEPFYRLSSARQVIALVGAHGTGKSSAIAKLANHCTLDEGKTVAMISLDRFRIDGNGTLEKISQIMDIPFIIAHDADQLRDALDAQTQADVILIDTPGMTHADTALVAEIACLLETADPHETHLVINATARRAVQDIWVETFHSMAIDHLVFTHMDEYDTDAGVLNLINGHGLPSSFYTDGVDLFDHLKETTREELERFCGQGSKKRPQRREFQSPPVVSPYRPTTRRNDGDDTRFVANRNSELFHHPDCKSVTRMHADNITTFSSIEQAIEEGLKPCRACCSFEMIRNAGHGISGKRRVGAV